MDIAVLYPRENVLPQTVFYNMDMGVVLSMKNSRNQLLKSGRFMFSDMNLWSTH